MSLDHAQLELQHLIQQFEAARPRVAQPQRADFDKRLRKLKSELSRLENYDSDIDEETPEQLTASVLGVATRLQAFLPEDHGTEALIFILPLPVDDPVTMRAHWDGARWTLNPQCLALRDVHVLAHHLTGEVCETNDLDLWRMSVIPTAAQPSNAASFGTPFITLGVDQ